MQNKILNWGSPDQEEEENKPVEYNSPEYDKQALLNMGAATLTGALFGDIGAGLKEAVSQRDKFQKKRDSFQEMRAKLLAKKRDPSGNGRAQYKTIQNEEGGLDLFQDKNDGRGLVDTGLTPATAGQNPYMRLVNLRNKNEENKPLRFEKSAAPLQKDFINKTFKIRNAYDSAVTGLKALDSENPFAQKIAIMSSVKEVESKLSDQDRAFYKDEVSALSQLGAEIEQLKSNELNPNLIARARQLLAESVRKMQTRSSDLQSQYTNTLHSNYPTYNRDLVSEKFPFNLPEYKVDLKKEGLGARLKGSPQDAKQKKLDDDLINKWAK